MNWLSGLAGLFTAIAAFAHLAFGSHEFERFKPKEDEANARRSWTQSLAGWHWVSFDLIFATFGFTVIGFTDWIENESQLLKIASLYFAGTGMGWLATLAIAGKPVKNRYVYLGQWVFCWIVAVLSFLAATQIK